MASERLPDSLRGHIAYDGTRTPVKTVLFVIICVAWLLPGLVGHDPWKSDDAVIFGVVHEMLGSGDWILTRIAGEPFLERAPLFFWTAAVTAKLLGGVLAVHDAARLASGLFMAATLACLSAAAFELMGERAMRVGVLLFIGCLGLLIRAHEMSTDLAGLAGIALALYGLAVCARQPRAGGVLAGAGLGVAFLGDGFMPFALLVALFAALPLAGAEWRTRRYALAVGIALACAAPLLAAWPIALANAGPGVLKFWLANATASKWAHDVPDIIYFARILPWYAWPAWPLAAWSLWKSRRSLASRPDLRLPLAAFVVFFAGLTLFADAREVNALPMLLPLSLLGVAEIDSLPRGAASALDWFGMTTFFLFAALIWIAWVAVMTGSPEGVATWVRSEVPGYHYSFGFLSFAAAALLTLIWLVVVARSLRTTRRALVNWTAGITMVWMLVMTLGVPLIDQARSYRAIASKLVEALPPRPVCVVGVGLGDAQRALLDYFVNLRTIRPHSPAASRCSSLLAQVSGGRPVSVGPEWTEVWRGSRPGDRTEVFVLYRRASS